jgi:inosose dehydratase
MRACRAWDPLKGRVPMNRRTFTKTLLAGVGAAALPEFAFAQASTKRLKIGITMLIFGAVPRTPENLEPAMKDCSELGYHSFETFASILEDHDKKGTLQALVDTYPIPLRSAYVTVNVTDPSRRQEQIAMLQRYARVLKKYGGSYLVQSCNGPRKGYVFAEHKGNIISALNDYGKAVNDMGLGTGLHQHTGTAVETKEETYEVMNAVDTRYMHFAPDIGQAQKGGTDAAQLVKDFAKIIDHMHFKDWKGWEHMAGYCPLGEGKVDLTSVLETMEKANPSANIMHELDGSAKMPYTARETAEISKKYVQSLGYTFRT